MANTTVVLPLATAVVVAAFAPTLVTGSTTDGTLQVTKADGTFGSLLLGATGATTGMKLVSSNGVVTVQKGDGSSGSLTAAGTVTTGTVSCGGVGAFNTGSGADNGIQLNGGIRIDYLGSGNSYYVRSQAGTIVNDAVITQGEYVVAKTTGYTVLTKDRGIHFTNAGASGSVTFTLPAAVQGLRYKFTCTAAQNLLVTAAANTLNAPGQTGKTTATILAANVFSSFDVVCYDGTNWVVRGSNGTVGYT